jgi:triosephosphate isomerase
MKYIVANWKCNPETVFEAKKILNGYGKNIKKSAKVKMVICPPFCYLGLAKEILKSVAATGGQDCHWESKGAFTGEVSPSQLAAAGCGYAIVGHSERRQVFGETDEMINKKVKAALAAKLVPIFCCGETREQRIDGHITDVVERQVKEGLKDVDIAAAPVIIAYEPVWAIGTGTACSPEEAKVVRQFIVNITNEKIPLLYGGSVNTQNAASYLEESGYNGLLVGGASLDPKGFAEIIAAAAAIKVVTPEI